MRVILSTAALLASTGVFAAPVSHPDLRHQELLSEAIQRCRTEQAAQPARVGVVNPPDQGFVKTQELGFQYQLEVRESTEPGFAWVDVETYVESATAASKEEVKAMPLGAAGTVSMHLVRHYTFNWKGGKWTLIKGSREMSFRILGLGQSTTSQLPIDVKAERRGSDAGGSCVRIVESARR